MARDIRDDDTAQSEIGIEIYRQGVAQAMGFPMQRQAIVEECLGELLWLNGQMVFEIEIGWTGDEAPHEAEAFVGIERMAGA
jgi:hypothetical protein